MRKYSAEASELLNLLVTEEKNEKSEIKSEVKDTPNVLSSNEVYKLPIRTGSKLAPIDDGDKPYFVGHFSPNAATDKNHSFHNGVDQKAPMGDPIYPIASGTVESVGTGAKSGNYVTVLHENEKVRSFYGHLQEYKVSNGQEVTQNTVIGLVGETGNAKGRSSLDPTTKKRLGHCHFEVKVNGKLVDPQSVIGKPVGSLTGQVSKISALCDEFLRRVRN